MLSFVDQSFQYEITILFRFFYRSSRSEIRLLFFTRRALLSPATTLIYYWYVTTTLKYYSISSFLFIAHIYAALCLWYYSAVCVCFRILWIFLWYFEVFVTLWSKMDSAQSHRHISCRTHKATMEPNGFTAKPQSKKCTNNASLKFALLPGIL